MNLFYLISAYLDLFVASEIISIIPIYNHG